MSIAEQTVWEGRPGWRGLAIGLFRVHWVALYFLLLALGRTGLALRGGESLEQALPAAIFLLVLGTACLALLGLLAWAVRRTTRYTITDRRIILYYGVALSATLAIPYGAVAEVALREKSGRLLGNWGDISIRLKPDQTIGYVQLWPHVRPWRLAAPQPMLRAVPDAAAVADMLVRLVQAGVEMIRGENGTSAAPPVVAAPLRSAVRSTAPG